MKRHQRWERIAIESAKQCGRGVLPRVEFPRDYAQMLRSATPDSLRLVLWEREGSRLKEVLAPSNTLRKIFFVVGPEGGLSQEEVEDSKRNGFIPVTLGKRTLRAETASLCFLSIVQYTWGDLG